jgi:phage terminase large subunit
LKITLPGKKFEHLVSKSRRYKVYYGGRGSGKSQTFTDALIAQVAQYGRRVGCFREYQNSIDDSVYSLFISEINRLQVPGFIIRQTEIDHVNGGSIRFKGLARNVESLKSMHDFDIFWIEEGQTVSAESLRVIKPTLRKPLSELWVTLNPVSRQDAAAIEMILPHEHLMRDGVYDNEQDGTLIAKVNHSDNKLFPHVLEQERLRDYKTLPRSLYDHIWEGAFYDEVDGSIIKAEWFDAAIDAHIKLGFEPKGAVVVSHDPSDSGDAKGLVMRHGVVVLDAQESKLGTVNDGGDWAINYTIDHNADHFIWDCDGMGVALQRQIGDAFNGRKITAHMYRGSGAVDKPGERYQNPDNTGKSKTNRDTFKNRRSQRYWELRDRFYKTYQAIELKKYIDPDDLISISSKIKSIDLLRSEVCRIPLKTNSLGLIQIMSKDDMRRIKIKSPNMADALKQSFDVPVMQNMYQHKHNEMEYASLW